jgi:hypothetical protein
VSLQGTVLWHDSLLGQVPSETVCIQVLDLRDNDLTYLAIREFGDALLDLPLKLLDLRGNPGISSAVVTRLAHDMPGTTIRTGLSRSIKVARRVRMFVQRKPVVKHSKVEKKKLRKDNDRLRTLVRQLESGAPVVELEPNLTIVGPRAKELARHLAELDQIMQEGGMPIASFFGSEKPAVPTARTKGKFKKKKARPRRKPS